MGTTSRFVVALALLVASPAGAEPAATRQVNAIAKRYYRARQARIHRPDLGASANRTWVARVTRLERDLSKIKPSRLDQQARITHNMLADELGRQREHVTQGWIKKDLNGVDSLLQTVVRPLSERKRRTVADWKWTIKNLQSSGRFVDSYIGLLEQGIKEGRVQPAAVVRSSIDCLTPLASRRRDNPFLALERELKQGLGGRHELPELSAQLRSVLREEVLPAHRRLKRFLRKRYLPHAGGFGNDRESYLHHMRTHLGPSHPSPEALGRWGQREITRLLGEMKGVMRQVDPGAADLGRFMRRLNRSKDNRYTSGEELMAATTREIKVARRLAHKMAPIPRSQVSVARVPAHEEATTAAQYFATGDRQGEMQVNTGKLLAGQRRYELSTLVTHEVYGGHHLAAMYARKQAHLPKFRREALDTAFDEGWALYAEQWRDAHGGFSPVERVGFLVDHLWRAARLVVDTGLHTGTMTRRQAVEYFRKNTFSSGADARAEVERYINWPGQALAYYHGKARILETRDQVKKILGRGYDERAFHTKLLRLGAVPLDEMQGAVLSWARRRAAQLNR